MKPFTPPSQVPTYRAFQFADTMEGTNNMLARKEPERLPSPAFRNRGTGAYPNYDPGNEAGSNFNSRGASREGGRPQQPNDLYGVPLPHNYKEPSRMEISLTMPIPEEIVIRSPARRVEVLPGTPDGAH